MPLRPLSTAAATPGDTPSATPWTRRPAPAAALLGITAAAVLVAALAWWTHDSVPALDAAVFRFFDRHRTPQLHRLAGYFSRLGSVEVIVPTGMIAGAVLAAIRRSPHPLVMVVATYFCAAPPAAFLKKSLHRPEPYDTAEAIGRSFPSGHATQATAVWGVVAVLVLATVGFVVVRRVVVAAAIVIPVLVGLAMLVRGAHWLTDMIGGYAIGGAAVIAVLAGDGIVTRRRRWPSGRSGQRRTAGNRPDPGGRT